MLASIDAELKGQGVTHQWSGDLSIQPGESKTTLEGRNSPMIWWPFNTTTTATKVNPTGVTHQWSGDLSIKTN